MTNVEMTTCAARGLNICVNTNGPSTIATRVSEQNSTILCGFFRLVFCEISKHVDNVAAQDINPTAMNIADDAKFMIPPK